MTREEAIKELQESHDTMRSYDIDENESRLMTALNMAIQALSQEPCDDAISRDAVNTLVDELARAISDERCHIPQRGRDTGHIMHDILDLPSVTQKSGKWIVHPKGIYAHLVCNRCLSNAPYDYETNYCPNCGAKMVEPQESETWNGIHGQITAPKGTFKKIWEDAESEE